MKTSFSLTPVGAAIFMAAEIIIVAAVAMAVLYLIFTFIHSWFKNGSFGAAVTTFEENVVKVGKVFAAPFVAVVFVFRIVAGLLRDLFSKMPWRNAAEFFAWLGGCNLELWRHKTSDSDKKNRIALGGVMFFTLIVSTLLAAHAWGDIMVSIPVGLIVLLVWFPLFGSIERAVIKSMDSDTKKKTVIVVGRLVLIAGVAGLNTLFANMAIFRTEIFRQIDNTKRLEQTHLSDSVTLLVNNFEAERDALNKGVTNATMSYTQYVAEAEAQIEDQRQLLNSRQDSLIGEIEGLVGTGLKGDGDAAKEKRAALKRDSAALVEMKTRLDSTKQSSPQFLALQTAKDLQAKRDPELVAKIEDLKKFLATETQRVEGQKADGFLDRYVAMKQMMARTPLLSWLLFLFFFTIEGMPLLMKIILGEDTYSRAVKLDNQKHAADYQYAAEVALQQAANDHANTMGSLYQQSVSSQAVQAATLKAQMSTMSAANIEFIKEIKNNLAAIDSATAGMTKEDADAVKKSLKRELFQKIGFGVN